MEAVSKPLRPPTIADVRHRMEVWRKTRLKRGPIPMGLWREAAELARAHGVNPIARALRLDYYSLKRQLETSPQPGENPCQTFVEVSVCHPGPASPGCVVELHRPDGARMRVQFASQSDLAVLSQSFWGCRP